jgi:hypothetical protein
MHAARVREAKLRVVKHPAYIEHQELEALGRMLGGVFAPNLRELMALLDQAATDIGLATELVQNVRPPQVREQFQAEMLRRLHNYVAAAAALVNHTRRAMQNRSNAIAQDFRGRRDELATMPEIRFVHELRNFMVHRTLPFLGHEMRITNVNQANQRLESEVQLSVVHLSEWDDWSTRSREFLAANAPRLQLRPLIRKHGDLVYGLNSWLWNALAEANAPGLADINRMIVELTALEFRTDMQTAERIATRRLDPPDIDEMLPAEPTPDA